MRIHVLQHVPFEGPGSIEQWAYANDHTISQTRLYAGDHLPPLDRFDMLLILGGLPVPPRPVWVAGPGLFLDSLLTAAGQENAAAGAISVSQGEIPLEKLLVLDVEAILTFGSPLNDQQQEDMYRTWSQVGPIRAITERRVARVGGEEWLSAGPRLPITLHHVLATLAGMP